MNKTFKTGFILFYFFVSTNLISQEIDTSLLSELTPEQLEIVKTELSESYSAEVSSVNDISESTVLIEKGDDNINRKFGYNYFSTLPTSISAVGDLPLPNDYKISLNDQFSVILSGSKQAKYDLNVNLDGTILFPNLGSVSVVGETFGEVKEKLNNLINQSLIGANIDLSIKNLAAKKITIVGEVQTPGTYLVNPFTTITGALAYSGGVSQIGTLRKIKLIRNNGDSFYFDLYKLLIKGERADDLTIEAGDVIIINPAHQFVDLKGQVKRPAVYEVSEGESLEELVSFGLGLTDIANRSNISVETLDLKNTSIKSITTNDLSYDLSDVLSVNINAYVSKNIANIRVSGAIKEPGFYSLEQYDSLEMLINRLEFVDVYPWLAVLEQFDSNNLIKTVTLFSLKDKKTYDSIKLLPNSRVNFANINSVNYEASSLSQESIDEYELTLNYKNKIFSLPVYGSFSVQSFIDYLGIDMSDVDQVATYISPLDNLVITDNYKSMNFIAKKFHNISFRTPVNDLIAVKIEGAVDYPGTYTLRANSTLESLYNLIGEFKDEAFLDGIIYKRQTVREQQLKSIKKSKQDLQKSLLTNAQKGFDVNVSLITALSQDIEPENLGRIAGNFKPSSASAINTIMLDGDSIFVPKNPNTINVLGEVINPIAFVHTGDLSISKAISNAGGYGDYANKRKVYVIKANGLIERSSRNIFSKNVKLYPGDTIVVPRKIITSNPGIDALLPITKILSDLAFSAAALESLQNNN